MSVSITINIILGFFAIIFGVIMFWSLPVPANQNKNANFPFLTIIIPARNEAERISSLLYSLQEQNFQSFEVLVVDDHSIDHTVSVAKAFDIKILQNETKRYGEGKSMACWQGVRHAKGEWLLFLDADTQFHNPDSLEDILTFYHRKGARGIVSLQPFHSMQHMYENLSAIFNIIVIVGMNIFTIWGRQFKTAGSFGPCILCNRDDYFLSGGHKKIRGALMDDLALGQAFLDKKLPVYCMGGKGVISFRMYPEGFKSLVEGWCKSFAVGSKSTQPVIMLMIIAWISGSFISTGALISAITVMETFPIMLTGLLYLLYTVQTLLFAKRCGNFRWFIFFFHPILFSFFTGIYIYSLFRVYVLHSVKWKDRKIDV
ncbi:4,4'-diaponeurosporenoate glycosyltransferase [Lentibacillus kapialis]|uniref:4,4'-diaponeurosporenoate glycosyltransferase n=1 Tax=Lentibacillus kapialis TaxID=340214 RepID=A0A917PN19_9BACI|nr:glycosyltransferase family 2 protein [Lentibacillus kapialis]GGJ84749.1 4,4'-diaponeurosporenoate glycosyltransferase [Lentibacillus kapialis]